ncbi:serine/threonine protein kinase [Microbacterium sp. Au-Mic1]|uniref:serine/threonine-protein kinase n=1 Tax=Microbacterium sp. Au-Mic1 TaxID=2906457 RepID=UPI001E3E1669|nr:serine/threonine-protein kinase [Microbacterium sp. Au-Mic1]MCE4026203.1 serine/threonine protein kinase [Microbacterium sp. Au-Mic1]
MKFDADDVRSAFRSRSATFLGSGTFGSTWHLRGFDDGDADAAAKILKPEHFSANRVQREIEGMQRFSHAGVARLIDVRQAQLAGTEPLTLICEYIPGGNVAVNVKENGLPARREINSFAHGLLSATSELHAAGTVHRDIKPDNIMLRDGDWARPVLIDFGLSKAISDVTITRYPSRVGSPPWMAPEQLVGERARKASDMWAIGVVLYSLLTGKHPYLDLDNPQGLDVEDLYDMAMAPHRPWNVTKPKKLIRLVDRLLVAEPLHARGSARRAIQDLGRDK